MARILEHKWFLYGFSMAVTALIVAATLAGGG